MCVQLWRAAETEQRGRPPQGEFRKFSDNTGGWTSPATGTEPLALFSTWTAFEWGFRNLVVRGGAAPWRSSADVHHPARR